MVQWVNAASWMSIGVLVQALTIPLLIQSPVNVPWNVAENGLWTSVPDSTWQTQMVLLAPGLSVSVALPLKYFSSNIKANYTCEIRKTSIAPPLPAVSNLGDLLRIFSHF